MGADTGFGIESDAENAGDGGVSTRGGLDNIVSASTDTVDQVPDATAGTFTMAGLRSSPSKSRGGVLFLLSDKWPTDAAPDMNSVYVERGGDAVTLAAAVRPSTLCVACITLAASMFMADKPRRITPWKPSSCAHINAVLQ
jgi:hypothetical protein